MAADDTSDMDTHGTKSLALPARRSLAALVALLCAAAQLWFAPMATAVMVDPGTLGGFEQDGNLAVDTAGNKDWANISPVVSTDDTADSGFQGSSKEEDPQDWICNTGGAEPPKGDILRAYVKPRISASEAWLDLAWVRQDGDGNSHLNFEFNKAGSPGGSLTGPCPINRQSGDFLVTYDFGGGSAKANVRVWTWGGSQWDEIAIPASAIRADTNAGTVSDPIGGGTVDAREFGEATLDLLSPALPANLVGCPGLGYLNVRSRSSESIDSALQDKLPTTPVDLNTCGKVVVHKVDDHDPAQPLAGAVFGLYPSATSTTATMTCTSLANGSCTFEPVAPGTWFVKEISAPAGYSKSTDVRGPIVVGFRQTVDVAQSFVDPRDTGRVRIVKKLVDDQGQPVVPADLSVLDGAEFVVYTDTNHDGDYDAGEAAKLWPAETADAVCTITGGTGSCEIGPLVVGSYRVHETKAPSGTLVGPDVDVTVAKGQTTTVSYTNPIPPISITLDKSGPAHAHVGDQITWTFEVSTSGPRLHDVQVAEMVPNRCDAAIAGPVKTGDDFLEPGETWTFSCMHVVLATDPDPLTNLATATGTDDFGRDVSATDGHSVDVLHPAITLDKKVDDGDHKPAADALLAHKDDSQDYAIVVKNTGDADLKLTALTDSKHSLASPVCDAAVGDTLVPGGEVECTYQASADADVHNVASVTATDVLGGAKGTVSADDETFVKIVEPKIVVTKSGPKQAHEGDTVTYTFTVSNPGNAVLTAVALGDNVLGGVVSGVTLLAGETKTFTKTFVVPAGDDDVVNTVEACGVDVLVQKVCDTDTHRLDVVHPALTLDKKVSGADHKPIADALQVHAGDEADYTVVVRNTGDVELEITALEDTLTALGGTCDSNVGDTLAVGGTVECAYTNVIAGDVHNVASATGVDAIGGPKGTASASDETFARVVQPKLEVRKSGPATAHEGDVVTYTFDVENTGEVALRDVVASDDVLGAVGSVDQLDPAEVATLTKTYTVPVTDGNVVNTVTACGTDILGGAKGKACDDDSHTLDVLHPALTLDKKVDGGDHKPVAQALQAHAGDDLAYTVVAKNTGDTPLTVSALTDSTASLLGKCDTGVGSVLAVGSSLSCTYAANAAQDVHNVASITGVDSLGAPLGTVSASDETFVDVVTPAIVVEKSGPAAAHAGDQVTYTFVVTNTGDVALRDVTVTDDKLGAVGTIASLQIGESKTLTKTMVVPAGVSSMENTATACGTDPISTRVCDDDHHELEVPHPAITLDKKVNGGDHKPAGDALQVHSGDDLSYTVVARNTGDTALTVTSLSDSNASLAGACDKGVGSALAVGGTVSCTYGADATQDVHNVASIIAVDSVGGPKGTASARDETFVDVIGPAITVEKSGAATAHAGDEITYSFKVTNAGDVALSDVEVNDDKLGAVGTIVSLAAGASKTLTKTYTVPSGLDPVHNTVTTCGTDPLDKTVCDDDDHELDVLEPALTVDKSGPARAHAGDQVTYSFEVSNTGDVALTDVEVTDDKLGAVGTIASLQIGESKTLSKAFVVPSGVASVENAATACARDPMDKKVCDDDHHELDVPHPAITLDKKVNGGDHKPETAALLAHAGDELSYTVAVKNTGDVPVTILGLEDTLNATLASDDCDHGVGFVLAVGGVLECDYTATAAEDEHNVASVRAIDVLGGDKGRVSASDETFVNTLSPGIDIAKAGPAQAHEGDDVTYTFTVRNTGDSTLTDVEVTDDKLGAIGTIAVLEPGESKVLSKKFTVPEGNDDIRNVATACGSDPADDEVCDTDTHLLDPIHPGIAIVKLASPTSISAAVGQATFTFEVRNTGDVRLAPVVVTDDILGAIGTVLSLDAGASTTLTRSAEVRSSAPRNVGTATGTDPLGKTVTATDDAVLTFVLGLRLPVTGVPLAAFAAAALVLLAAGLRLSLRERLARVR